MSLRYLLRYQVQWRSNHPVRQGSNLILYFGFLFVVLEIELRASHLLVNCSATEVHPQPLRNIFKRSFCLLRNDFKKNRSASEHLN